MVRVRGIVLVVERLAFVGQPEEHLTVFAVQRSGHQITEQYPADDRPRHHAPRRRLRVAREGVAFERGEHQEARLRVVA